MLFFSTIFVGIVNAQKLPKWEAGIGLAGVSLPIYRGAKSVKNWLAPWPLLRYRSEQFSIDEEGVHRWFYRSETMNVELSVAAGLPVSKDESGLREGMPGLDSTLEIGPNVEINLWKSGLQAISINFPLRTAISVDIDGLGYQGWTFSPFVHFFVRSASKKPSTLGITLGPQYANTRYHEYYYGVAEQYQTLTRPAFQARSGYSGSRLSIYYERKWDNIWFIAFARYDQLKGVIFKHSPLLETNHYFVVGFSASWIFAKSSHLIETFE